MIIIIGLPGSGKTYLAKSFPDHIVFDDFINDILSGTIQKTLKNNKNVILTDPRLCNYETFKRYCEKLQLTNFQLILFENDPQACIDNVKNRDSGEKLHRIINDINNFSKIYNVDLYGKNISIRNVYKK